MKAKSTGRIQSTGMELTFCKLAVEAHGGEIGVESEPGKGTTFFLSLPGQTGTSQPEVAQAKKEDADIQIQLTKSEKDQLKLYITGLPELMVYEASEIRKILDEIKPEENLTLDQCKKKRWNKQCMP